MLGNRNSEALAGTLYLKRAYRRNFIVAETSIIIAIGFAIAIAALVWDGTTIPLPDNGRVTIGPSDFTPPPRIFRPETEVIHGAPPPPPDFNGVEAVDDTLVPDDRVMPSRQDYSDYYSLGDTGFAEGAILDGSISGVSEILPSPDSFVAVDEQPKALQFPAVKYPEIARKMSVEGSVWLKVLIDTEGNVVDVIVAIPSKANVGFEEAAVAAAHDSKWRPAMQNKQPIMVWVSYEVRFKLK